LQGQKSTDVDELALGKVDEAQITDQERALLDYVKVLTLEPAKVRDTDVERLRKSGWTDEQIFEASYITSLFAFFNRMADAYGLDYQPDRWLPPDQRPPGWKPAPPPEPPAGTTPAPAATNGTTPAPAVSSTAKEGPK
jgi:hypothetical protein